MKFAENNIFCMKFPDCIGNSWQFLQVPKEVTGDRVQSRQLSTLKVNGFEVDDCTEIANDFNHLFVSVGPNLLIQYKRKRMPKSNSTVQKQTFISSRQY